VVTRQELLRLFEQAADDAISGQIYGTIEVTFKAGVPEMLRTEKTVKLNGGNEQSRAKQTYR
jgi:hypothetical protein